MLTDAEKNVFGGLSSNVNKVYSMIQSEGRADVTELTERLGISESTVRRALLTLEERRLISRYHGGAAIARQSKPELSVFRRADEMAEEKKRIAQRAASFVEPGDNIILTGGSTVAQMCDYIQEIADLTVITDSVLVVNGLRYCPNVKVIALGGVFNVNEQCFEGVITSSNMKSLRSNKVFLGIKGITSRDGFLTDDIGQAEFYKNCAHYSGEVIILAANNKFYQDGIMPLFAPSEVDLLITDRPEPHLVIQELERAGCRVEIAE